MAAGASKRGRILLYVLNSGNLYGTERMALATLQGLDDYDARVVFAPPPSGTHSVLEEARRLGFRTERFASPGQFVRALVPWLLRHRRVDMIGTGVSQSYLSFAAASVLGVRLRQIQVVHGGTEDDHAYGKKRSLNRIPVLVVAVSEYVRAKLIEHGVRRDRIRVIENFVVGSGPDARRRAPFDARRPGAVPLDPRAVRVAVVSRVDPIKRIDLLVDAVAAGGLEDFVFDVYGTGQELERLRARAAAHPQLRFHGFVEDLQVRLADADFLLHLCPSEPFGLAILEAFVARIVAVVPDAGGAASIVEAGVTGLTFRANDVDDLRRVLLQARDLAAETLQRIADAAAASLDARFSPATGMQRYRDALAFAR